MSSVPLITALVAALLTTWCVSGCSIDKITVAFSAEPTGTPLPSRHNVSDVEEHFRIELFQMRKTTESTFSCIDSRGDERMFGTPGGDFNEFAMGLSVLAEMTNQELTEQTVSTLFQKFIDQVATVDRPFYYHTDDVHMQDMFTNISNTLRANIPRVLPLTEPENSQVWLDAFSQPQFQGCGHVRLSVGDPLNYGYKDPNLLKKLLRVLLRFYWRGISVQKIQFAIKLGSLAGRSMCLVSSTGGCEGGQPRVFASTRGSSAFVYHPVAVKEFRRNIMAPFFKSVQPTLDETQFATKLQQLSDLQVARVLGPKGLYVANQVNVYTVTATVSGSLPEVEKVSPWSIGLFSLSAGFFVISMIIGLVSVTLCAFVIWKYRTRAINAAVAQEPFLQGHAENL